MEIRLMTHLTSAEAHLRVSATTAAPGWPHVGECTFPARCDRASATASHGEAMQRRPGFRRGRAM